MPPLFNSTADGWPYIQGTQNASLIDDYALELANKLDAVVPFAMAAGTVNFSVATSTAGTVNITFPVGRFSVAPIVNVTMAGLQANTTRCIFRVSNISTTGCTVYIANGDGTSMTITNQPLAWTAIQMATNSASG